MDVSGERVTICELIADVVLSGGSIEDWPDMLEEMIGEIDAMIWGEC